MLTRRAPPGDIRSASRSERRPIHYVRFHLRYCTVTVQGPQRSAESSELVPIAGSSVSDRNAFLYLSELNERRVVLAEFLVRFASCIDPDEDYVWLPYPWPRACFA